MIKVRITDNGCAMGGRWLGIGEELKLSIDKLPPRWEGKAVIVKEAKKLKKEN
jgi:hypothetical protein